MQTKNLYCKSLLAYSKYMLIEANLLQKVDIQFVDTI